MCDRVNLYACPPVQARAVFDVNTQKAAEQRKRECKVGAHDGLSSYEIRASAVLSHLKAELAERRSGHVKQSINYKAGIYDWISSNASQVLDFVLAVCSQLHASSKTQGSGLAMMMRPKYYIILLLQQFKQGNSDFFIFLLKVPYCTHFEVFIFHPRFRWSSPMP